ncbi:MraY family glycosyltransferase [Dyella tabacisoli]|uniref:Glycosyl transferase family 4 n=1 Tax=Dyella tabacisoli TaxID=2282381 RepID=A0A369UL50_9GAMM|nr:glycosyltransferase family 4 protein [Dyella tabacisoli]RDD81251.1 glycosyl transferase family 4 [Dyella tabacisoli]
MSQSVQAIVWMLASLLLSMLLVRGAIAYAHRRGMLDQPGQRRSHSIPTPRGGGIGLVIAAWLGMISALALLPGVWPSILVIGSAVATLLVAAVGWWDDHHALPVLPRLGVQLLAVLLFAASLIDGALSWLWLPVLLLAGVWSINLHNFMDGIDGLLAQQAIFVGLGLGLLSAGAGQPALATAGACLAAASLGFWWYNRPRARIFMGDVGSGTVGLLIFALTAMLWRVAPDLLWPALILSSAFMVDAALTLLNRMWRGRRWYTAHREHLYQWLVRSGFTHSTGGACYLAWNMLIAAPLAMLAWAYPRFAFPICVVVYLAATAAWTLAKHHCLWRVSHKAHHVTS